MPLRTLTAQHARHGLFCSLLRPDASRELVQDSCPAQVMLSAWQGCDCTLIVHDTSAWSDTRAAESNDIVLRVMCAPILAGIASVVLWEVLTPVSLALAVLPPLWVAWALHDNLLTSPILWGMLVMMPLKFVPGGPFRWI